MINFILIISLTFPGFNQDLNFKKCAPLTDAHFSSFKFHLLNDVKIFSSLLKSVEITLFLELLFCKFLRNFCTCLLLYIKWAQWLSWQGHFPECESFLWLFFGFSTICNYLLELYLLLEYFFSSSECTGHCVDKLDKWQVPTKTALSLPLLNGTGERKYDERLVGRDKDRERSLTNYCHGPNRWNLGRKKKVLFLTNQIGEG